jgi:adenylate kinase
MLAKFLKIPVISPGELLRQEQSAGSKLGLEAAKRIQKGRLVKEETIEKILAKRLAKKDIRQGFIFDGFPRNHEQLKLLFGELKKLGLDSHEIIAVYIHLNDKEVKTRIGGRRVCDCGASYHLKYNPPKNNSVCDVCGKKIYRREDDTPAVIKNRLQLFHEEIIPLIKFFKEKYVLIKVDGSGDINKIQKEIKAKLKPYL